MLTYNEAVVKHRTKKKGYRERGIEGEVVRREKKRDKGSDREFKRVREKLYG